MAKAVGMFKSASLVLQRWRTNGARDVQQRVARRIASGIASRFETANLDFPLLPHDISDSTRLHLEPGPSVPPGTALNLAWVCTPPVPGSGGHTTLFRMVASLENRGHRCTLLVYDRHGGDLARQTDLIRRYWPTVRADIRAVPPAIRGFDGCIASSWETAHVLASRGSAGTHRFYFIQDFEPFFYPRGSLYSLAEDTYRFGFRHIALGQMVSATLKELSGVESATVSFGCDTDVYFMTNKCQRNGIVFYARESVDRRGFLLARMALEEFHSRHPEQMIHIYGDSMGPWSTPHRHHGRLSPSALCTLYNSCIAGLAMSFTNISLVAEEMLACGVTPIVNDHRYARLDLSSPTVVWAPATPGGLTDAMCRAVETPVYPPDAGTVARVRPGWGATQVAVAQIIERDVGRSYV